MRQDAAIMSERIAILGAGIIGLLSARELRARGQEVVLLDVREPARGASWAGGGILSPLYPWRYPPAVNELVRESNTRWEAIAADLHRASGIDPEYTRCGLLVPDATDADAALAWATGNAQDIRRCDPRELAVLQPGLGVAGGDALWMPGVAAIRNPRLLKALLRVLADDPGVTLRAPVLPTLAWRTKADAEVDAGGGSVVLTADGKPVDCDGILVCAGAWSAGLLAPLGLSLPVRPVKGQMLLFPPQPGLLRRIVLHDGRYLIPRRDGRILCGSTVEETGFDATPTAQAAGSLRQTAIRLLPALRGVEPENHWAGLRPGSPDGVPVIARLAGNLVVNAGHFRNGLVMAPASAVRGVGLLARE